MSNRLFGTLLILSVSLTFLSLHLPLFDTDEPRYAETARMMLKTGDFVVPTFNQEPRFAKPVFFYWLIAASYLFFGVNELAARLPSVVAGLGLAALMASFAYPIGGFPLAGLTALCLLVSPGFQLFSHAAITDMVLTFLMSLAVISLWRGLRSLRSEPFLVAGMAMGLAVLTKGPTGFVLPLLIPLLGAVLADGGAATLSNLVAARKSLFKASFLFLLTTLPWYIAVTIQTDGAFLRQFLFKENIARFAGWSPPGMPFFGHIVYFPAVLFVFSAPWGILSVTEMRWRVGQGGDRDRYQILLTVWALLPIVLFTFSRTKNPQYALLSLPALISLAALWLNQGGSFIPRGIRLCLLVTLVFLALTVSCLPFAINLVPFWKERWISEGIVDLGSGIWWIVFLLLLGAVWVAWVHHRWLMAVGLLIISLFSLAIALASVAPRVTQYRQEPIRWWARSVSQQSGFGLVVVFRRDLSSAVFYSRRKVLRIDDPDQLARLAQGPSRLDVLVRKTDAVPLLRQVSLYPVGEKANYLWLTNTNLLAQEERMREANRQSNGDPNRS
ncbi:MAG: glycosyltransferase family 39 protein [Armatimonadetes bacterium]|nr:glycosyltransferase family 39 protein [Armatimonadota bacterium]MDW8121433.1 glycosyltransferase family 39 protein [Armatimonadota bacterium]